MSSAIDKTFVLNKDGSATETANSSGAYETQGKPSGDTVKIAGIDVSTWDKGEGVTYTYHYTSNTVEIKVGE